MCTLRFLFEGQRIADDQTPKEVRFYKLLLVTQL